MTFKFDIEAIRELMHNFYTISQTSITLFDNEFNGVVSFPDKSCEFCRLMHACKDTCKKCDHTDMEALKRCKRENSLIIYKCHAGLTEAVIPIFAEKDIIGYLMFGQITADENRDALYKKVTELSEKYGLDVSELRRSTDAITYKSHKEIQAAAKIMEACTSYIVYKELITPEQGRIIKAAKAYIEENLDNDFDIANLCSELSIGRTKLYELFKKETNMGVSEYLRRRRVHKAKKLLKTTDLSIAQIAESVGFSDYNYFSRVYKKVYGKSPRSYR